jgi:hypothetical protein
MALFGWLGFQEDLLPARRPLGTPALRLLAIQIDFDPQMIPRQCDHIDRRLLDVCCRQNLLDRPVDRIQYVLSKEVVEHS